jgi:uncharacterized protein (DUF58 family)
MAISTHFRALDLAARLPPLLVAARQVAQTVAQGAHGRRRAGPGDIFWQFRHSQPGDSLTAIDWRQSARSDHLFVRETEWAAAQTVWLWRDASASMDWRSGPELPTKRERAELLILALAALLLRAGERVALLSGALTPTGGQGALERLAEALDKPAGIASPPLPRHVPVVLAGDFLAPLEEVAERIRMVGGHGHLVQILDPAEESLPYQGRVRFEGMEGEGEMLARRAEGLRVPYGARLAAHRDGLSALARSAGWSFAIHRTDQPPQYALLALHARLAEAGP